MIYTIAIGIVFILYAVSEIVWYGILGEVYWPGIGLCILQIIGLVVSYLMRPQVIESVPVINVEEVSSDDVRLDELTKILEEHELELRIRRTDKSWNITFLRGGKVPQIVGVGSAITIYDAVIKAEADFLERQ